MTVKFTFIFNTCQDTLEAEKKYISVSIFLKVFWKKNIIFHSCQLFADVEVEGLELGEGLGQGGESLPGYSRGLQAQYLEVRSGEVQQVDQSCVLYLEEESLFKKGSS